MADHKETRFATTAQFQALYDVEGEDLSEKIGTSDEKLAHHYTTRVIEIRSEAGVDRGERVLKKAKINRCQPVFVRQQRRYRNILKKDAPQPGKDSLISKTP